MHAILYALQYILDNSLSISLMDFFQKKKTKLVDII